MGGRTSAMVMGRPEVFFFSFSFTNLFSVNDARGGQISSRKKETVGWFECNGNGGIVFLLVLLLILPMIRSRKRETVGW